MHNKKYNSQTGGVDAFPIEGRLGDVRERLRGMTDEERAMRAQFLKDQVLSPNEPRVVPELYLELNNPIRRFYKRPLDMLFEKLNLAPKIGAENAQVARVVAGKIGLTIACVYLGTYYLLYNGNDWTRASGWYAYKSREWILPGHPEYPKKTDRTKPSDHFDKGFKNSPI